MKEFEEKTLIGQGIIRGCNGSHILHLLISQNLYCPEIAIVKYIAGKYRIERSCTFNYKNPNLDII